MPIDSTAAPSTAVQLRLLRRAISKRFSLLEDKASDEEIERRIRDGVELRGATPWILMFAILVASVGLNVNSTAVIIGAMLISPLMGPIMGAGLGVAVYDFALVKRALFNLGIATVLSLVVSALYFALSPLHEARVELLARTSPTLWDVLIALFGGLAGVVANTREEKSNVIPGVAIATALMPPVCTAGYGLATGQWAYVGGAMYLYTINCVFISLATVIGIRVMRLKRHGFTDAKVEKRVKASLLAVALCTALPSAYLAMNLVRDEVYKSQARTFVADTFNMEQTHVAESHIDSDKRMIELVLIGERLGQETLSNIEKRIAASDLAGTKIIFHQTGDDKLDVTALKSTLLSDLYKDTQLVLQKKETELTDLRSQLSARNALFSQAGDIRTELVAQYPEIAMVLISEGLALAADGSHQPFLQLTLRLQAPLKSADRTRIEKFFQARTKNNQAVVTFDDLFDAGPTGAGRKVSAKPRVNALPAPRLSTRAAG